jgi:very-short-patch-repair endonuclease
MSGVVALVVVLAIAGVLIAGLQAKTARASEEGAWPYYAKKPLSVPEQILYFRLSRALPQHIVLAQVGLSRLLGVKKGSSFHAWNNRINRMSADFVVCGKDSNIVAVIELDDASHNRDDRRAADAKKDRALAAAGIHIIRWPAKAIPDEASIKAQLLTHFASEVSGATTEPAAAAEHSRATSRRAS